MKRLTGIAIAALVAAMIILIVAMIDAGRDDGGERSPDGHAYRVELTAHDTAQKK